MTLQRIISNGPRAVSIHHQGGKSKYEARLYVNCCVGPKGRVVLGDATLTSAKCASLAAIEGWASDLLGVA